MSVLRVLHVDDEADIREVVEMALGIDPGIVTLSCASGREALVMAARWSPNIILLDVMMPAMDGPHTLKRLRENPRTADIPVVFMTARAQCREINVFKSLGAVGVIPKPFDPMTLATLVHTHVRCPEIQLSEMRNQFLVRLDRDIATLAKHRSTLVSLAAQENVFESIRGVAHGLAGAGGVFGFDQISVAAAMLEEAVIVRRESSGTQENVLDALDYLMNCAADNSGVRTHRVNI